MRSSGRIATVEVAVEERRVSKYDWLHGLTRCPGCGLSLDSERDTEEHVYDVPAMWTGVRGLHRRCGARFTFEFGKAPREQP